MNGYLEGTDHEVDPGKIWLDGVEDDLERLGTVRFNVSKSKLKYLIHDRERWQPKLSKSSYAKRRKLITSIVNRVHYIYITISFSRNPLLVTTE